MHQGTIVISKANLDLEGRGNVFNGHEFCFFSGKFECPNGWSFLQGDCFKNVKSKGTSLTWDEARTECKSLGADLASVKDEETQTFLYSLLDPKIKKAWIGGQKVGEQWTWVDGTPFDRTGGWSKHSGPPGPSGDGSYMELNNWSSAEKGWNDLPSYTDNKRHVLCKLGL